MQVFRDYTKQVNGTHHVLMAKRGAYLKYLDRYTPITSRNFQTSREVLPLHTSPASSNFPTVKERNFLSTIPLLHLSPQPLTKGISLRDAYCIMRVLAKSLLQDINGY
ncbi:hypothetical protein J6590_051155 [Homalodisca vitripennis]|nr:hypothetical protein J6590_051155 [Homalodisca vitripennis]